MSYSNNTRGKVGEDFAITYLKRKGYKIVERNFRIRGGEIDIIAIEEAEKIKTLVFIEVKTRTTEEYGEPIEAIGYYKMKALTHAAIFYKHTHPHLPDLLRIDAIIVMIDQENTLIKIELVKNI